MTEHCGKNYSGNSIPIAVIGMGCYYPGARDLRQLWENILARRQQFRRIPDQRLPLADYFDPDPSSPDKTYGDRACLIDGFVFDWISRRIPKTTCESTDIVHWLALEVALTCIEDAGFTRDSVPTERTCVILGNTLTGEQTRSHAMRLRWPYVRRALIAAAREKGLSPDGIAELAETMEAYYKSVFAPVTEDTLAGGLSNTIAGRICNYLNLHGGGYTVDGACSSSLIAVATAATSLTNGTADLALAGGVDISLDTFELVGFSKTGALTSNDMNVYDRRADGFIPGEGCGFVMLKRLEDARTDGDYVYAVLNGWGISSDGRGGITAPNAASQALAIRRAYEYLPYSPCDLDFIEGHGTGTTVGDKAELEGIALSRAGKTRPRSCGVTSFKSIVGHTKAAAGIGGLIKTVMAVNRRILPPTAGCKEPNPVFEQEGRSLYPVIRGVVRAKDEILHAGVTGAGFGGINCHVTLASGDHPCGKLEPDIPERTLLASHQDSEIFVCSAGSIPSLLARMHDLHGKAAGIARCEMADLAAELSSSLDTAAGVRAALIAESPETLLSGLDTAAKILQEQPPAKGTVFISTGKDICIGNNAKKPGIGILFPGQGSQFLNMGRLLVERNAGVREFIDTLGNLGLGKLPENIYRLRDRAADDTRETEWLETLHQTEITQPAICLTSLLWFRELERLGIQPIAAGGHSLGELTAFYASGAFDAHTLLRFAAARGKAMAAPERRPGAMAALACSHDKAQLLINQVSGYAVVANINSPEQVVISGERTAVEIVVSLADKENIRTRILPVSNAFHSSLVTDAARHIRSLSCIPETLDRTTLHLYSSVTGNRLQPRTNLRKHFADQVCSQCDFVSMITAMAHECDLFVEVGPGSVLTGLVSSITAGNGPACLPLESRAGEDRDLNAFLGYYFAHGGTVRWKCLYENRLIRPFVPAAERVFIENPLERPFNVPEDGMAAETKSFNVLEKPLSQALDLNPRIIAEYLSQRGDFLSAIIKADMQTLRMSNDRHSAHAVRPAAIAGRQAADILLLRTAERTGFPAETLTPDMKLLDDLNLDSIKAAELVAETARELGIAGRLDPAQFANATLADIINEFDKQIGFRKTCKDTISAGSIAESLLANVSERTGFPRDTLSLDMHLLDDLNLDSIKSTELIAETARELQVHNLPDPSRISAARLSDIVSVLAHAASAAPQSDSTQSLQDAWVRNFAVEPVEQDIAVVQQKDWTAAHVLLAYQDDDCSAAHELQAQLESRNAYAVSVSLKDLDPASGLSLDSFTDFIIFLNGRCDKYLSGARALKQRIHQFHSLTQFIRNAELFGNTYSLSFVSFGDGRFGTASSSNDVFNYCTNALAASIHHEHPDALVRVIDFAVGINAVCVANQVLAELEMPEHFSIAGYDETLVRRVPRARVIEPCNSTRRPVKWTAGDVILVTGGAKGITAECALAFARQTGVKIALAGRSPVPDMSDGINRDTSGTNEITVTLERYRTAGIACRYYQCDVTDGNAVAVLIRRIAGELGEITGVIHGAGLNRPARFTRTTADGAYDETAPKILGALNLCHALQAAHLKLFAGLTSIIGVTGMPGNAWYGFSNEALDLLLSVYKQIHPETAVVTFAFSIWDTVGMGIRMGSVERLAHEGIQAIPVNEGTRRFVYFMLNDPGVRQVVIAARFSGLDTWHMPAHPVPDADRYLDTHMYYCPDIELITQTRITLERDPYVKDHAWKQSYLFPTVFGLEAMAQAVAYLTGERGFSSCVIEDIVLERPIVVHPENGIEIQIRACTEEREREDSEVKINVTISTEQSGFTQPHFSAVFVLKHSVHAPEFPLAVPGLPLDIDPAASLYGSLLFQGPRFQRLQAIYALNSRDCIFSTTYRVPVTGTSDNSGPWLLGDPYFRDSLLQIPQLVIPRDICLPVKIHRLERYTDDTDIPDEVHGIATVYEKAGQQYFSSVSVANESGGLLERLDGYTLQILEHHENNPTAEEIAAPGKRDEEILRNELLTRAQELDLEVPEITLEHVTGIHQLPRDERHRHEKPLMERTVALAQPGTGGKITIDWMKSGKPVIKGAYAEQVDISLAHDDDTIVCVAGNAPQGCDVAFITHRSFEQWVSLLGNSRMPILQELCDTSDSLDQAGTRIWAAGETFRKALNRKNITLSIHRRNSDTVVFTDTTSGNTLQVVTFPVRFTRPPERMIAITVRANGIVAVKCPETWKISRKAANLTSPATVSDKIARKLDFDLSTYNLELIAGPQNRPASLVRYPVTFREASNRSRTLHFSRYFNWIGTLRELTLNPVIDKVVELLSSGKWGMVTNHTETRIFDEAHTGDIIEGCLWLEKLSGSQDSTLHLCFEWHKITANNMRSLIALSTMSTTWVEVHDGGKLEIKPLPGFFKEYVNKLLPRPADDTDGYGINGRMPADMVTPESFRQAIHTPADLGRELYREPAGPVRNSSLLSEMTLDTSLEDANLVGNVYFANYYVWQGRARDHYFHNLVTAVPSGIEPYGELRCVFSRVDHTAEAMPFDSIRVKMYLTAVFECGIRLYFEYYRISGDMHTKLAYGEHEALWTVPNTESNWIPAPLPAQFRNHLLK